MLFVNPPRRKNTKLRFHATGPSDPLGTDHMQASLCKRMHKSSSGNVL